MPNTADGTFHVHRIFAMSQLMAQGNIYPRWIPWFHLGYGYPVFNYYSPLATWLGGVMGVVGLSAPLSFQLITAGSWVFGTLGVAVLGRRFLPDAPALLAATLWMYAPVRMHEYWVQGSLSHIVATALVPWMFLGLIEVTTHPNRRTAIRFGIITALMLLAHQPTTYLMILYSAGLGLAIWGLALRHPLQRALKMSAYVIFGLVVALGLSSVFVLPALLEIDDIVVNDVAQENTGGFLAENTLTLADQFRPPQLIDHTDFSASIYHSYGLWTGILCVIGFASLLYRRHYAIAAVLGIAAASSVFLATRLSMPIWQTLPEMEQLRFPWRVLRVGIVPVSLLAAASLQLFPTKHHEVVGGVAIVFIMSVSLPILYPLHVIIDFKNQTAADFIRYEVATGTIGGTSYNEFKPAGGDETPLDAPADLNTYESDPFDIHMLPNPDISATREGPSCWQISTSAPTVVSFRQFYFPGWHATLDNQAIPVATQPEFGLMQVELAPTQAKELCLHYVGTSTQHIAAWITIFSIGFVLVFYSVGSQPAYRHDRAETPFSSKGSAVFSSGLLIAAVINGFWIGPHTDWFRLQSPPDNPYYMESKTDTNFAYGYDLLGYTLTQDAVKAGDTLTLTLYWRPLPHTDSRQFYPVFGFGNLAGTNAWGAAELPFIGLNPYNHTSSLFISQQIELRVFEDAPPFVGKIYVHLWNRQTNEPVAVADGSATRIALPDIIAILPQQPTQSATPQYVIADAIAIIDASAQQEGDQINLRVTWQTQQSIDLDGVSLFIHGLDSSGNVIAQQDQPLFHGDYPPRYWRSQHTITQQYILPSDEQLQAIAIGLYTPETRLSMRQAGGVIIPDGRAIVTIE